MMLAEVLKAWRWHERISVREAAGLIGVPSSTFARFENGLPIGGAKLATIYRWMLED